jgi:hypothetical protein
MRAPLPPILALIGAAALAASAGRAQAGEARCWYENGAVVVAGAFGDIAGDFILDSTAPRSLLHDDVAHATGIDAPTAHGDLLVAGERLRGFDLKLADMNEQEVGFPTTIVGVIGADVLTRFTVRIDFAPCRVTFLRKPPGRDHGATRLELRAIGGVPAVAATAFDGTRARPGLFAVDTASLGVRLVAAETSFSRPLADPVDPTLRFRPPGRLRGLSFGDQVVAAAPAGLLEYDLPGLKGAIGTAVLSRYRITFDLKRGWLDLTPAR